LFVLRKLIYCRNAKDKRNIRILYFFNNLIPTLQTTKKNLKENKTIKVKMPSCMAHAIDLKYKKKIKNSIFQFCTHILQIISTRKQMSKWI